VSQCLNTVLWKSMGSVGKTPDILVLMSALDYERQASRSGRFISGERAAGYSLNRRLGGPKCRPRHLSWQQISLSLSSVESPPCNVYMVSLLTELTWVFLAWSFLALTSEACFSLENKHSRHEINEAHIIKLCLYSHIYAFRSVFILKSVDVVSHYTKHRELSCKYPPLVIKCTSLLQHIM
jgi:hypothetical protein